MTPTEDALAAALAARGERPRWHVVNETGTASMPPAEIVVCDGAEGARAARTTWPAATIVALVSARDDGTATIAAMNAGAHACVRGDDPALISAYLCSIARRRGVPVGAAR